MSDNFAVTIWGIHAGKTGDAEALFKKGYIALGWNAMGDLTKIPSNREAFKSAVAIAFPEDKLGSIPVIAGQLYRFVHAVKQDDLVVFRSKIENVIKIGRVAGEYQHRPDLQPGYPNVRPVTWIREIEPLKVSQGAKFEIGSAMSFFQVKAYAEEWLAFLGGTKPTSPVSDGEADPTTAFVAASIEDFTTDFVLSRLAKELKGHPLAAFVAHLLETMGYRTRVSPVGTDGGVDVVAHRDELGFEPPIIKVQVKSGTGNVGNADVAALLGTLSAGEFGLFVTLAGFTIPAQNFAKGKANLRLIDGSELVQLTLAHYEQFDSRYKGLLPLQRVYVPQPIDREGD